jgi:hypothetical protein
MSEMSEPTQTTIDPEVDLIARLYEHLARTRLKKHTYVIDHDTQHVRESFRPVFTALVRYAQAQSISPRTLIDGIIAGIESKRQHHPTFNPRTKWLGDPAYVRYLIAGGRRRPGSPR